MKAETEAMRPQAQKCLQPRAEGARGKVQILPSRESAVLRHLDLGLLDCKAVRE